MYPATDTKLKGVGAVQIVQPSLAGGPTGWRARRARCEDPLPNSVPVAEPVP